MKSPIFGIPTFILTTIGTVRIDAVLNVLHRFPSLISKNPTETGEPVSDNIVNLPNMIEMEGRISDTPLFANLALAAGIGASAVALTSAQQATRALQFASGGLGFASSLLDGTFLPGYAAQQFNELRKLRDTRQSFRVVSGLDVFEDMAFELLSQPATAADGRSIRFSATMTQIIRVDTNFVPIDSVAPAVNHTAVEPLNVGHQTAVPIQ